jgi:hypothetical protein
VAAPAYRGIVMDMECHEWQQKGRSNRLCQQ